MDISTFMSHLFASDNAVLPSLLAMRLGLAGVWAIVLGSAAWLLARPLARPYRLGLALLVLAWTLVPGAASPAYWLGLAFQTPSWTSALICLGLVYRAGRGKPWPAARAAEAPAPTGSALTLLVVAGIVLGWVLLLDTLAVWPISVYAWGFSSAAVTAVGLLAALGWAIAGPRRAQRAPPGALGFFLPLLVLTIFVLTRLPSGNLWDALIDPWLWLALHAQGLISVVRRWQAARHASAATRAGTASAADTTGWPS